MELPVQYQETMKALLGAEYEEYIKSLRLPVYRGLRVNTSKIEAEEFERISPFPCVKIPWIPNGYYISPEAQASRHPYYAAGLYYLQEPSAMTPARTLPIEPGDRVLDLCAAPGGKATELAARLKGQGLLVANDISNTRARGLLKNLELFGLTNILVTSETPEKLSLYFPEFFDKILVDAPCSGEGMFRKDPSMIKSWQEHGPEHYASLQREILQAAVKMLRPGGMLLYSTCTFHPLENEGSIQFLLDREPQMSVISPEPELVTCFWESGFYPGRPELLDGGSKELSRCFRLYPHRVKGEGHFLALLKKAGEKVRADRAQETSQSLSPGTASKRQKPKKTSGGKRKEKPTPTEDLTPLREFFAQLRLNSPLAQSWLPSLESPENPLVFGQNQVYLLPEGLPNLQGLRFLRTGCLLGELAKKRFTPSQALAMALGKEDWPFIIDFSSTDPGVFRYLKGETLEEPFISQLSERKDVQALRSGGWCLVCVEGFPLGWGKLVNGALRNKYHTGWIW